MRSGEVLQYIRMTMSFIDTEQASRLCPLSLSLSMTHYRPTLTLIAHSLAGHYGCIKAKRILLQPEATQLKGQFLSIYGPSMCRGFHGDDYEECRLLGYKNPVRTSQETHYASATEPSQLILCKI
jgi:hypothetical protein